MMVQWSRTAQIQGTRRLLTREAQATTPVMNADLEEGGRQGRCGDRSNERAKKTRRRRRRRVKKKERRVEREGGEETTVVEEKRRAAVSALALFLALVQSLSQVNIPSAQSIGL